ncbi:MAG: response regulator transcription factor [Alphaproteobacteria bacterium]|nr:response regulator transcription factor [Alphaproteobacteria bacterium]
MNNTILVIDDDEVLNRAIARGLRGEGFNVISATSAEDATQVLARIRVDGIILDRMMSGIDGLTFLQDLRTSGNTTPILMLTAMTGAENSIAGLAAGANDYLGKPFQLRELVLRLKNMLKNIQSSMTMPNGLIYADDEFFVGSTPENARIFMLSGEEKKFLQLLTSPIGNIAPASPMVAKRLRMKLNSVLSNLDIITVRGQGYKLIDQTTCKK